MKYLIFSALVCRLVFAREMTPAEHLQLHNYNQRPSLRQQAERKAQRLPEIDISSARKIARKVCTRGKLRLRLTHRDTLLYYIATTPGCTVWINALDGSLIVPGSRQKEQK